MLIEQRRLVVEASPAALYREFTALGGRRGWLALNQLWRLRGLLDRLVGGVAFAEVAVIQPTCGLAMRSTSGELKRSSREN